MRKRRRERERERDRDRTGYIILLESSVTQESTKYIHSLQTEAEYTEKYLTYRKMDYESQFRSMGSKVAKVTIFVAPENANWPEQVDWKTRDAVSSVKDQVPLQKNNTFY